MMLGEGQKQRQRQRQKKYRNTEIQKYRNTEIQKYRNKTKIKTSRFHQEILIFLSVDVSFDVDVSVDLPRAS
jgi:hypothetical protein